MLAVFTVRAVDFISPVDNPPVKTAGAVFEKAEINAGDVVRAIWKVTGQGVFEAYVNGSLVGDDFLKPGFTEIGKCRHVYSYDVTELIRGAKGSTNVFSATVAAGWWCDAMMSSKNAMPWQVGKKLAFRGEIELEYADGKRETRGTDSTWRASYTGPVVEAGIYEGETYDARRKVEGLKPVEVNSEFNGEFRPAVAKIVLRRDLALKPISMYVTKGAEGANTSAFGKAKIVRRVDASGRIHLKSDELLVVDFGQNASAVPAFQVVGASGTTVKIRHAEMLNEANGEKSRGNDGPAGTPYLASLRSAKAALSYTLGEGPNSFMPRHTFFGYRYLAVTATAPVTFYSFRSVPVSSVTRKMERGAIKTGNERVNRLIENIRWGVLSNYLSIPTDCPQRDERLGWTADTQVFMNSAAYLLDSYEFLAKYLADLRDAQRSDGLYPCFAPNTRYVFPPWASCGWTDAGILIPYRLWKWYGRSEIVETSWASMKKYMDFLESDNEPYRINHGDWLAFEHTLKKADGTTRESPDRKQVLLLNAAFRVWMAELMREMAEATDRKDEIRHFADEAVRLRAAFAKVYIGEDGCLKKEYEGQCNDLYVLMLDLCSSAAAVETTKRHLIADIRTHGDRLQTGFLGTAILMPTLTFQVGAAELAYSLLLQDKFPSWLYSVDQGATTIWERWNGYTKEKGFGPVSMNSFNHYAYGCVLEWLYSAAAGIRPDPANPGWKHFILNPFTDRRLGHLEAAYNSPVGRIKSAWRYGLGGRLAWSFTIPAGTMATVIPPWGGDAKEYEAGTYHLEE